MIEDVQKDLEVDREDEDDLPPVLDLAREDDRRDGCTTSLAWEIEPVEPDVGQVRTILHFALSDSSMDDHTSILLGGSKRLYSFFECW